MLHHLRDAEHGEDAEPEEHEGPKIDPMRAVPRLCTANRPMRIAMVIGITYGVNTGVTTSRPSTALSTEMAGVIMPSP